MALIKQKTIKGYNAEYWKITNIALNLMEPKATCVLALFKDKATRDEDILAIMEVKEFTFEDPPDLDLVPWLYGKIKASNIQEVPVLDKNGDPTYDINGNMITEIKETNWFVDAEDILEI